ncbi:MAG: proline iminopeptidase-family hydrolase, partial [Bacteroidota bacterium]
MKSAILLSIVLLLLASCKNEPAGTAASQTDSPTYDFNVVHAAGVRMVSIQTPAGQFKVWTKKIGDNPRVKVLLLHGGPAATHEYMESFESFLPAEGWEMYLYDQLGSYYSDQPKDSSLWTTARFVEEVEQVRQALGLDNSNFYLLGNSWGGILALEYALKYQQNLKGLVISNMMSSAPLYDKYAEEVLAKQMDPKVLAEIMALEAKSDFANPRYMELLLPNFYAKHLCRLPEWPDAVNRTFEHVNGEIYTLMQGPSEFGIAGRLETWDVSADLPKITVPTLMIGATHDTMDPEHMKWMSTQVKKGRYLHCPDGSHMSMWDDQR